MMGNDGPKHVQTRFIHYKLGVLGLHWPVSTTKWNGIHFKIRIPLSCQFKVCGLLTRTKMVDDDNHH